MSRRTVFHLAIVAFALSYLALYARLSDGARGDGFYTYLMVKSLVEDFDLDLSNQVARAGNPWRYTADPDTGHLRMRYEVWPMWSWAPMMLLGRAAAWLSAALGIAVDEARLIEYVTLLTAPLAALLGAFALYQWLRRHVDAGVAMWVSVASITATHLVFYALANPGYVHPIGFALVAWIANRADHVTRATAPPSVRSAAGLGCLLGLLVECRPQAVVFGLLPLFALIHSGRRNRASTRQWVRAVAALAVPALIAVAPIFWLFNRVYGSPVETFQGPWFMRWGDPWLMAVWFSSAGGLFTWTPGAWLGIAGLAALAVHKESRPFALLSLFIFVVHSYVNACAWDFWGGVAFGARRESELLVLLAAGQAAVMQRALKLFSEAPRVAFYAALGSTVAVAAGLYLAATSAALKGTLPLLGPTTFARRASIVSTEAATLIDRRVGDPMSLPANWLFAMRHNVELRRYSCVVGRSLLEPSAATGRFTRAQTIDLTADANACLVGPGFGPVLPGLPEKRQTRAITGAMARVLLPVHTPTTLKLSLSFWTAKACKVLVQLDGTSVGGFTARATGAGSAALTVGRDAMRSDVQDLDIWTSLPNCLYMHSLTLTPADVE